MLTFKSDHAWHGNYFVAGGQVGGKKILGNYPDNLSNGGPEVVTPGIVIPSTPWDAGWNEIGQWFGATSADDLNEAISNRNLFSDNLFR